TPAGIVRTIRSAIDLLGEDHVSLGSDFDGAVATQFDTSELAALTHEMLRQGFSKQEIHKVMGGNMLRVLLQILP
ncbi:MAG: membrane dipeptidase, partial [Gammaproteobacteria bacterium]|nr:membrane dipeptidase [Gammaproteobacteria bacterium]